MEKQAAEKLLQTAVDNPNARFRNGQWEAIGALVNHRRKLMVVQRTGWGKSSVYFISTRILRDRGAGPTVIVSPLLALMRNQIEAATRLGIRAETINSTNQNDWPVIRQAMLADQVDAILISPERLSNESFVEEVLMPVADRIGLLVVDEVHCISDWGHDFRPDYRRLINVLRQMPPNMPVLGTTATANNRVIEDVQTQLGNIGIQRGALVRESLALQTLRLPDQASRLAWLARHIPELPGTGIVYVLTKRDAEQVATWLNRQGIVSKAYYSGVEHEDFENSDPYRQHLEDLLLRNEVKALVATTALGMGYDKPDLGFVIHYQAAGSVVAYYQQVGRAGRAIDKAYGVLLSGREDEDIHEYFRRSAFPDERNVNAILDVLAQHDELSWFSCNSISI
jgi:ATP-dependent DNA helicase RecQ